MTNNEGELRDWRKGTPKSAEVDSYGEGQHFSVCVWGGGGGWDPPQSTRQNLDHLWRGLFSNVFLKPYSLKKTSKTLLH